jgi:uncharacterized protein
MASNKTGSLDTNALLRLVLGDVPKQTAAVESLLKKNSVFDVSDIAIIEMVFVLEKVYHLPRPLVADNIYTIIRHSHINCNRKLFTLVLPLYLENSKLSIVDCALTKYAELNKATPLYTFDADLAKACSPAAQLL